MLKGNRSGRDLREPLHGRQNSLTVFKGWLKQGVYREGRMRTEIATTDMGLCPACDLRMEAGEWVSREGGETIHTGCLSWRSENRVIGHTESSGFLFSESEDAAIERAKEVLGVDRIFRWPKCDAN